MTNTGNGNGNSDTEEITVYTPVIDDRENVVGYVAETPEGEDREFVVELPPELQSSSDEDDEEN